MSNTSGINSLCMKQSYIPSGFILISLVLRVRLNCFSDISLDQIVRTKIDTDNQGSLSSVYYSSLECRTVLPKQLIL